MEFCFSAGEGWMVVLLMSGGFVMKEGKGGHGKQRLNVPLLEVLASESMIPMLSYWKEE